MKEISVGLAGLGTVGVAFFRALVRECESLVPVTGRKIKIYGVSAQNKNKDRGIDISSVKWFENPIDLAQDPNIDIFIELMGGASGSALNSVKAALNAQKAVITANKALIAEHGFELAKLAEQNNVPLSFEASSAGAVPAVRLLRDAFAGQPVRRIRGILNGTCNFILTRMEQLGSSFEDALKEAQVLGYAEADPTFDVDGFDTAHKLTILSSLAFGTAIESTGLTVQGIRSLTPIDLKAAEELGFRIKLLGYAEKFDHGIERRVEPVMLPKGTPLSESMDVLNAVAIKIDKVPEQTLVGPGAGGDATASAVMSDLVDIARGFNEPPFGRPANVLQNNLHVVEKQSLSPYYIRILAIDKAGTAARIAHHMAQKDISLESILQRHQHAFIDKDGKTPLVPVILITYATSEQNLSEALSNIANEKIIAQNPQVIRIEK